MNIRKETRDVWITSDDQTHADEATAKLHEARFQLSNLIHSEWYSGIGSDEIVDLLLQNPDRTIGILKEFQK